jgi:uncharacterized membrane protein YphA (DoxX/SURF4 family)
MIDRMATLRPLVGRLALGGVLLYFGVGELWNPGQWTGYIPQPLHFLPAVPLLLTHGYLLFAVGGLLLLGAWTRPMSWLSVALLASIVAGLVITGGGTSLYVRDLGLTGLALMLALEPQPGYGLDTLAARRPAQASARPMPRPRAARQS